MESMVESSSTNPTPISTSYFRPEVTGTSRLMTTLVRTAAIGPLTFTIRLKLGTCTSSQVEPVSAMAAIAGAVFPSVLLLIQNHGKFFNYNSPFVRMVIFKEPLLLAPTIPSKSLLLSNLKVSL